MSATDELRRLLDERREKHSDVSGLTLWLKEGNHYNALATERADGSINLVFDGLTPEQTIDATLGRGKCRFEIKDNCNDSEGTCCDVWFECSGCHAKFDYWADEWLMQENYCPACGRKVER